MRIIYHYFNYWRTIYYARNLKPYRRRKTIFITNKNNQLKQKIPDDVITCESEKMLDVFKIELNNEQYKFLKYLSLNETLNYKLAIHFINNI